MTISTPDRARVITFVGESRREKVIFDGLPEDAQQYIEQRFPRLHIEPGSDYGDSGPTADAVMDIDGKRTFFDGKQWGDWTPPTMVAAGPDDRDTRIAELEAQLAAAQNGPKPAPLSDESSELANLEARLRQLEERKRIQDVQRQIAAHEAELNDGATEPPTDPPLTEPSTLVGANVDPPETEQPPAESV
jgi:hypothetical protein